MLIQFQPIFYLILSFLIWVLIFKKSKDKICGNEKFKDRYILTIIVITYMLQPGLIKTVMELFNCQNFGSNENRQYYLAYDSDIKCLAGDHLGWMFALGFTALILCRLFDKIIFYRSRNSIISHNQEHICSSTDEKFNDREIQILLPKL